MAVPAELLHEFSEYVVKPFYPGGISSALMDLVHKAVKERNMPKSDSLCVCPRCGTKFKV